MLNEVAKINQLLAHHGISEIPKTISIKIERLNKIELAEKMAMNKNLKAGKEFVRSNATKEEIEDIFEDALDAIARIVKEKKQVETPIEEPTPPVPDKKTKDGSVYDYLFD